MTDVGELVFLPHLIKHLRSQAPNVNRQHGIAPPRHLAEALEIGTIDIVMGPLPDLTSADLPQQVIFDKYTLRSIGARASARIPGMLRANMEYHIFSFRRYHFMAHSFGNLR